MVLSKVFLETININWVFEFNPIEVHEVSGSPRKEQFNNVRTNLIGFEFTLGIEDWRSKFLEYKIPLSKLPWVDLFVKNICYSFLVFFITI